MVRCEPYAGTVGGGNNGLSERTMVGQADCHRAVPGLYCAALVGLQGITTNCFKSFVEIPEVMPTISKDR
jgi:hypothetical protein